MFVSLFAYKKYPLLIIFTILCCLKASSANVSQPVSNNNTTHLSALAKEPAAGPRIQIIPADHLMDKKQHEQIIRGIHFLYNFYITKFNYSFSSDLVVKIRVFENYDAYKKYIKKVSPTTTGANIGLYIHRLREAIVWKNKDESSFLSTLFHETNHLLLRSTVENCPKWLNEGLSEYFEFLDVSTQQVVIKPQGVKDHKIKRWLADDKMPDLYAYLTTYNEDWDKENNLSDAPRALAWSMVYFLMEDASGQDFIKNCLHYFSKKQIDKYASVRALDAYYPGKHTQFEKDWLKWIPSQRSNHILIIEAPAHEPKVHKLFKKFFRILG